MPDSVEVHNGFGSEHAKTAATILAETQKIISEKNATQVMVVRIFFFLCQGRATRARRRRDGRALPGGGGGVLWADLGSLDVLASDHVAVVALAEDSAQEE